MLYNLLPLRVESKRLSNILFCSESAAQNQADAIQDFIKGTIAEKAPVVPISAQLKYNVDAVCEYIVKRIPVPVRDFISPPQMIVIRSFDVNKPGSEVEELRGGVAGGSILQVIVMLLNFVCSNNGRIKGLCFMAMLQNKLIAHTSLTICIVIRSFDVGSSCLVALPCC